MPVRNPEEIHSVFTQAFNSGDLEALVAMYEPGATLAGAPGQTFRGSEAIREAYRGFLSMNPRMQVETRGVFQSADGIALTHGRWRMTGTSPDGAAVQVEGRSAEVLRRQPDGTWLVAIDNPFSPE